MNKIKIKSFEIIGLFGTDDIKIPFKDNIKILIGENGLGKTQVLNLFYYTLTKNFFRLSEYNFKNLTITFSDNKKIEISKKQVDELVDEIYKHPMVKELISDIGYSQFEVLRNKFLKDRKNWHRIEDNYIRSNTRIGRKFPMHHVFRVFEELEMQEHKHSSTHFDKCKDDISHELKGIDILYFPTYRRVEEDLYNLGYDEDELKIDQDNNLIQFGMSDVQKTFNRIENKIETLLKEGLSNFLKDVLKIVMSKNSEIDKDIFSRINDGDLAIIFARAKNLDKEIKEAVLESVAKKEFNDPLSGLILQKLVELYENQKELDKSVKIFRDACNKYLINKSVFYDESAIKIYIKSTRTNDKIDLKHLSSGEKQIVSMLANIYLSETDKRFLILFDEPELSLSMMWQKLLLPDILNSNKCDFLLAVTHSPFIFDNELDVFAVGMSEYVKPSNINVKQ